MKNIILQRHRFYKLACGAVIWTGHETLQGAAFHCQPILPSPKRFSVKQLSDKPLTDKSICSWQLTSTWSKEGEAFFGLPRPRHFKVVSELTNKEVRRLRLEYKAKEFQRVLKACGVKSKVSSKVNFTKLDLLLGEMNSKFWHAWAFRGKK